MPQLRSRLAINRVKAVLLGATLVVFALGVAAFLYRRGFIRANYPDAGRFPVRGVDVSHHQGDIDWDAVRSDGVEFAFIKASEGQDHRDREFERNWDQAGRSGLARGAYHFFTFCTPGVEQAQNFLGALGDATGELAPVVDIEFSGNCASPPPVAAIRVELRAFLAEVRRRDGRSPILYFTREANARVLAHEFDDCPRWPRSLLWKPRRDDWSFWQFADNGRVAGIDGLVDLDVFNGTREEFERSLNTTREVAPAK